ncbi:hypothetical protein EVAR_2748_1 [Eumeta japonica]|uniref:Uncharacterized protein n=1 Tax=Eumeta variegata TaxID=151549 RepID=A0A4C1T2B0_EUMVA|nr:hypothetical protein EVAR_2748_1 [Eumeta japonica]
MNSYWGASHQPPIDICNYREANSALLVYWKRTDEGGLIKGEWRDGVVKGEWATGTLTQWTKFNSGSCYFTSVYRERSLLILLSLPISCYSCSMIEPCCTQLS